MEKKLFSEIKELWSIIKRELHKYHDTNAIDYRNPKRRKTKYLGGANYVTLGDPLDQKISQASLEVKMWLIDYDIISRPNLHPAKSNYELNLDISIPKIDSTLYEIEKRYREERREELQAITNKEQNFFNYILAIGAIVTALYYLFDMVIRNSTLPIGKTSIAGSILTLAVGCFTVYLSYLLGKQECRLS